MNTQKTPSTVVTVNQILDRCEQECLDELVPRNEKDSRRHFVHLRAHFGPRDVATAELRTFTKRFNVQKRRGRARRLAMLSAAFTIAVRHWFSVKANFLREVERE